MAPVLVEAISYAIGISLSPFVVITVVLLLLSKHPYLNPTAYLVGWVGGMLLVTWLVLHFLSGVDFSQGEPRYDGYLLNLVVGLLMVVAGTILWFTRPGQEAELIMPGWLNTVQNVSPALVFLLGLIGIPFNIKNLALYFGAMSAVLMADLTTAQRWIEMIIVIIVASLGILIPLVLVLAQGNRADATLDRWRTWLLRNQAVITAGVMVFYGLIMAIKGLAGVL